MTPLETIRHAMRDCMNDHHTTPEKIEAALVAEGHLPAPDVTIQVTLTPEEAHDWAACWQDEPRQSAYGRTACKVRDAILEARGAQ